MLVFLLYEFLLWCAAALLMCSGRWTLAEAEAEASLRHRSTARRCGTDAPDFFMAAAAAVLPSPSPSLSLSFFLSLLPSLPVFSPLLPLQVD